MLPRIKWLIFLLSGAVLVFGRIEVGTQVLPFSMKDSRDTVYSSTQLAGRVLVIDFWGTW